MVINKKLRGLALEPNFVIPGTWEVKIRRIEIEPSPAKYFGRGLFQNNHSTWTGSVYQVVEGFL
jgi:hypothetical protein